MSKYKTQDAEQLAELFKALANPQILKNFIGLARCCRPGLIHMKRAEQHVECWANPDALERLAEFFSFAGGEAPPALAAIAATQDKTTG